MPQFFLAEPSFQFDWLAWTLILLGLVGIIVSSFALGRSTSWGKMAREWTKLMRERVKIENYGHFTSVDVVIRPVTWLIGKKTHRQGDVRAGAAHPGGVAG